MKKKIVVLTNIEKGLLQKFYGTFCPYLGLSMCFSLNKLPNT